MPHVLLNCFEASNRFPTIIPDDYQLAYDLTKVILERGYRRPVFLNLPETVVASGERARGFLDAAHDHGLDLSDRVHIAGIPLEEGGEYLVSGILPDLMQSPDRPDLILCGQDLMAISVYFALNQLGLAIGRDVAVASFDNLQPITELLQPGLSTMEVPYYEMGRAAMTIAIDGVTQDRLIRMRGRFINRQSM